ncbi:MULTISPECIES: hypothetical protein [unclassified Sphingopyxis]|uniref:hypothetical protein n=1 Tax=unclassified Sphingopyxis TaxID=2614943 RepID=UPI0007309AC7|nr:MULTISPECIES: hypothetical protein [unclassified Sphingopyxis]KTE23169.1 hypothetical protein ATE61_17980 [Sphingopyxis sp. H057]KTE49407.1 hypothetical protein ATE64_19535 [Sphingopyxis sp. H073]KTE50108.1 hypothetical protein ATE69_18775 [Sphingopyxis sp. H071]KTE58486.1 hypothetical protein ATE66_14965 [Sphingopyxis sp. H107]KTE63185.1 hypothetical protein ATE65_16090 [Sphingopyxis sp. H100]
MRKLLILLLATLAPAPAFAANQVALDNNVFVERVSTDASGKQRVLLEEPKVVVPGDRLVFVLNYRNAGGEPADKFVITNPMPSAVRFAGAADASPIVSVDGGKAWGALDTLSVIQPDGTRRPAQPADVTHIRWAFQKPIPAGGTGKLMFRGVVK